MYLIYRICKEKTIEFPEKFFYNGRKGDVYG